MLNKCGCEQWNIVWNTSSWYKREKGIIIMIKNSISGLRMRSMKWHKEDTYLWHICFTDHMSELQPKHDVSCGSLAITFLRMFFGSQCRLVTGPPVVKSQGLGERVRDLMMGVYDGDTSFRKYTL